MLRCPPLVPLPRSRRPSAAPAPTRTMRTRPAAYGGSGSAGTGPGTGGGGGGSFPTEDIRCPICVELISNPFVTPCGHTFCFACISTHLRTKSSCPSCGAYLVQEHIHPNFLLDKVGGAIGGGRSQSIDTRAS